MADNSSMKDKTQDKKKKVKNPYKNARNMYLVTAVVWVIMAGYQAYKGVADWAGVCTMLAVTFASLTYTNNRKYEEEKNKEEK